MLRGLRLLGVVAALAAASAPTAPAHAKPSAEELSSRRGRPTVKLDRLDFPTEVAGARYFKKRLRRMLEKHVRRVEWGAGRNNTIEYRFAVTTLKLEKHDDVLRVSCTAVGRLPGGKSAKSHISFGGDPRKRNHVVEHVLEIVSRGVITRLAELERVRRGDLDKSRVRAPRNNED